MRESVTFMAILDEGRQKGREVQLKTDIQELGEQRFGPADEPTLTKLNGITDIDHLQRIHRRLLKASSWLDLLDTP
ncbi:MAG TPA: hypothetical protein VKA46_24930 [Gemmataceae bacterium]|nr:hypothetical protein [Gemmataceae bacterium]